MQLERAKIRALMASTGDGVRGDDQEGHHPTCVGSAKENSEAGMFSLDLNLSIHTKLKVSVTEGRTHTLHLYRHTPLHYVQCVICVPCLVGDCHVCVCWV